MSKAVNMVKAVGITMAFITAAAVFAVLMAWLKGLLALILIFVLVVWAVYSGLERREWHRNYRQRAAEWRSYK